MDMLDTRGLACPEPVLLTKNALKNECPLTVLADNNTAVSNITRFASNSGYSVEVTQNDGGFELLISRP